MKAFAALARFRPGAPFRPWLLTIVANEARNRRRSAGRRDALALRVSETDSRPDAAPSPEAAVLAAERRAVLWPASHASARRIARSSRCATCSISPRRRPRPPSTSRPGPSSPASLVPSTACAVSCCPRSWHDDRAPRPVNGGGSRGRAARPRHGRRDAGDAGPGSGGRGPTPSVSHTVRAAYADGPERAAQPAPGGCARPAPGRRRPRRPLRVGPAPRSTSGRLHRRVCAAPHRRRSLSAKRRGQRARWSRRRVGTRYPIDP